MLLIVLSDVRRGRDRRGCDLAIRRKSLGRGAANSDKGESESSLDGVNGGEGGR